MRTMGLRLASFFAGESAVGSHDRKVIGFAFFFSFSLRKMGLEICGIDHEVIFMYFGTVLLRREHFFRKISHRPFDRDENVWFLRFSIAVIYKRNDRRCKIFFFAKLLAFLILAWFERCQFLNLFELHLIPIWAFAKFAVICGNPAAGYLKTRNAWPLSWPISDLIWKQEINFFF